MSLFWPLERGKERLIDLLKRIDDSVDLMPKLT